MFRTKLIVVGLAAMLAIGALNSASATTTHWWPCQRETGNIWHWTTRFCFPAADPPNTGEFALLLLAVSTRLNVTTEGGLFTLSSTVAGIKLVVDCAKETGTGWIENPSSGNGIDLETSEFKECTLTKPEGQHCTVTNPIKSNANTELEVLEEQVWDLFKPDPSTEPLAKLTLSGCASEALDGTFSITGKTAALLEQTTSTLKFGKTMDELKLGGSSATLEGNAVALSDAGNGIQAL